MPRANSSVPATSRTPAAPGPPGRAKQDGLSKAQTGAPLKIGGLLPKTGDLSIAYPPLAAGATLAIKEINAAGGVLGEKVVWVDGDDGTSVAVAKQTVASPRRGRRPRDHRRGRVEHLPRGAAGRHRGRV